MREERLSDDALQCGNVLAGDRDLLRLARAPFGHAEEEAEAGRVALGERPHRLERLRRDALVLLISEQKRVAQKHVARDRRAARGGVVEEVLRPRDELLAVHRRVEEAAVFFIAKARE